MTRSLRVGLAAFLLLVVVGAASASAATTVLRLNGIGPLKLGMTRAAAVHTGWLAHRAPGCELASPRPITYQLNGHSAPAGLRGSVEFTNNKLTNVSASHGARTALGVTVGVTTPSRMVTRYRRAGFQARAQFDPTFQATFVNVKRRGRQVLTGLADGPRITLLAVPFVAICD